MYIRAYVCYTHTHTHTHFFKCHHTWTIYDDCKQNIDDHHSRVPRLGSRNFSL